MAAWADGAARTRRRAAVVARAVGRAPHRLRRADDGPEDRRTRTATRRTSGAVRAPSGGAPLRHRRPLAQLDDGEAAVDRHDLTGHVRGRGERDDHLGDVARPARALAGARGRRRTRGRCPSPWSRASRRARRHRVHPDLGAGDLASRTVMWLMAAFDAAYGIELPVGRSPATDETLTTAPTRRAQRVHGGDRDRPGPEHVDFEDAAPHLDARRGEVVCAITWVAPALLTSTSSRPWRSSVFRRAWRRLPSPTTPPGRTTRRRARVRALAGCHARPRVDDDGRALLGERLAVSSPIPLDEPVTTTTLPVELHVASLPLRRRTRQEPVQRWPGSKTTRSRPVRSASGGQVIGSTLIAVRRRGPRQRVAGVHLEVRERPVHAQLHGAASSSATRAVAQPDSSRTSSQNVVSSTSPRPAGLAPVQRPPATVCASHRSVGGGRRRRTHRWRARSGSHCRRRAAGRRGTGGSPGRTGSGTASVFVTVVVTVSPWVPRWYATSTSARNG